MRLIFGSQSTEGLQDIWLVIDKALSVSTTPYLDLGYTKMDTWLVGAGGPGGYGGSGWTSGYAGAGGGGGGGSGALVREAGLLLATLPVSMPVLVGTVLDGNGYTQFNGKTAYAGGPGGNGGLATTAAAGTGGGGGAGGSATAKGAAGANGATGGPGGAAGGAASGVGGRGGQGSLSNGTQALHAGNGTLSGLVHGGGGGGGGFQGLWPNPATGTLPGNPGNGLGALPGYRKFFSGSTATGFGGAGGGGAGGHDLTALTGQPGLTGAGASPTGVNTADPALKPGAGGQGGTGTPGSAWQPMYGSDGIVVLRMYR